MPAALAFGIYICARGLKGWILFTLIFPESSLVVHLRPFVVGESLMAFWAPCPKMGHPPRSSVHLNWIMEFHRSPCVNRMRDMNQLRRREYLVQPLHPKVISH